MTSFSIFNWRILIFKADINYHAKYIACYLSTYMNEHGDNCFPSIDRIAHESGVSRPTVIKYIQELKEKGWLESKKKGFDGQAWAHNQYFPNIPKNVVKEINHLMEGGQSHNERQSTSQQKAVKEVNSSSTDNSIVNSTERKYPKELNISAWNEYIEYRKESKIRKLTVKGEEKQIEKIIGFGDYEIQQQCINETIANGWQGIFPPKGNSGSNKSKAGRFLDRCVDGWNDS